MTARHPSLQRSRRCRYRAPAAALAAALGACGTPGSTPITFADLRDGQTVMVSIHSTGCFHEDWSSLRMRLGADGTPQVDVRRHDVLPWNPADRASGALSKRDLRALDSVMSYYRAVPAGTFCTTREDVTVTLFQRARMSRQERFSDVPCPRRLMDEIIYEALDDADQSHAGDI